MHFMATFFLLRVEKLREQKEGEGIRDNKMRHRARCEGCTAGYGRHVKVQNVKWEFIGHILGVCFDGGVVLKLNSRILVKDRFFLFVLFL